MRILVRPSISKSKNRRDDFNLNIPVVVAAGCAVVLIGLVPLLVYAMPGNPRYFQDNLLPGFASSAVDGLLFVAVLGYLERRTEARRLARLHETLFRELSFLGEVMKHCVLQADIDLGRHRIDASSYEAIADSLARIREAFERRDTAHSSESNDAFGQIAHAVALSVQVKARVHLRRLQPLAAVAAELTPDLLTSWTNVTDRLFDLTREEGFDDLTKQAWKDIEWTYAYSRLIDLFRELSDMGTPPYRMPDAATR
jgi:hypothetical protein